MGRPELGAAVWFPAARRVEIRPAPVPAPGPGEVRIRALASAISHGTELLVYRGQVPPGLDLDLPTLRGSFAFPIKYGYASVGRVLEVGPGVEDLRPGDLAFTLHPHQTEYVVPATLPAKLQPDLDPRRGVFLANTETAVNVLLDAAPRIGERVLISGQGTVGLLITQLLRRAGAGLIVAVDPLPGRRVLARAVGADVALAPGDDLVSAVRDLTGGIGADLAIEVSGNVAALDAVIEAVAFQGTVIVTSWYGTKPATLHLGGAFHRGRVRIQSSQVGSIDPALQPRWTHARRLAYARDLLPALQLDLLITHEIPFERTEEAYALIDEGREETGQVILTYAADLTP